jgi:hypothetical protein
MKANCTRNGLLPRLLLILTSFAFGAYSGETTSLASQTDGLPAPVVLHAKKFSFSFTAPRGWVIDRDTHEYPGLEALIYPTGTVWKTSVIKMHVLIEPTEGKRATPFFPTDEQIKTAHGVHALIRYCRTGIAATVGSLSASTPCAEAYITEGDQFVEIILGSDDAHFEDAKRIFKSIVNSYRKLN